MLWPADGGTSLWWLAVGDCEGICWCTGAPAVSCQTPAATGGGSFDSPDRTHNKARRAISEYAGLLATGDHKVS
jgi:hypothetical protein